MRLDRATRAMGDTRRGSSPFWSGTPSYSAASSTRYPFSDQGSTASFRSA